MVRPRSASTGYNIDLDPASEDAGTSSQRPISRTSNNPIEDRSRPPSIEITADTPNSSFPIPASPRRAEAGPPSTAPRTPQSSSGATLAASPQIGRARSPSLGGLFSSVSRRGSVSNTQPPSSRRGSVSSSPRSSIREPSIRIRRFPSVEQVPTIALPPIEDESGIPGRRRSTSEPQRPTFLPDGTLLAATPNVNTPGSGPRRPPSHLENIQEVSSPTTPGNDLPESLLQVPTATQEMPRPVRQGSRARRAATITGGGNPLRPQTEYESSLVDILDLVDPEVATLQTLTNVQNSLFVPDLGRLINRMPTYNLTRRPTKVVEKPLEEEKAAAQAEAEAQAAAEAEAAAQAEIEADAEKHGIGYRPRVYRKPSAMTIASIASTPTESYYAVLPHGVRLEGWSQADVDEMNDHVRHMLHSKRSKFKRSMKGFGQYVKRPLGFFITLYATLITLFGLAWVLFLIGWISVGSRKDYLINVIDNVLVALFAIMGDGLAPFRCVDTYHMCFIAHYHHLTWRLRREKALPQLQDDNDLPAVRPEESEDLEEGTKEENEFSVLNENQQKKLIHHQKKFSRSHTFYKPHETTTHHAFPLRLLVAIVCLLDCHSLLQISLGACTWSISCHHRPFALTTVILCASITVNITAGVLILVGDRMTRKKDVLEIMKKQELTTEAINKLEKRREKEAERNRGLDDPLLGTVEEGESRSSSASSTRDGLMQQTESGKGKGKVGVEEGVQQHHFGLGTGDAHVKHEKHDVGEEPKHHHFGLGHGHSAGGQHEDGNGGASGKEGKKKLRKEQVAEAGEVGNRRSTEGNRKSTDERRKSSDGRRKLQKKGV